MFSCYVCSGWLLVSCVQVLGDVIDMVLFDALIVLTWFSLVSMRVCLCCCLCIATVLLCIGIVVSAVIMILIWV